MGDNMKYRLVLNGKEVEQITIGKDDNFGYPITALDRFCSFTPKLMPDSVAYGSPWHAAQNADNCLDRIVAADRTKGFWEIILGDEKSIFPEFSSYGFHDGRYVPKDFTSPSASTNVAIVPHDNTNIQKG